MQESKIVRLSRPVEVNLPVCNRVYTAADVRDYLAQVGHLTLSWTNDLTARSRRQSGVLIGATSPDVDFDEPRYTAPTPSNLGSDSERLAPLTACSAGPNRRCQGLLLAAGEAVAVVPVNW